MTTLGTRRTRWAAGLAAAAATVSLGACVSAADPDAAAQVPDAAVTASTPAAVPGAGRSPSPSPSVDVDFSGGRDAPGMSAGLPSPSGWYQAAIGETPRDRVLYLTFDDGPASPYTEDLLDLLARHDARATFFQVGSYAARRPDLVRRIASAGHALGNHTWSHPDLMTLTRRQVHRELADTRDSQLGHGGGCMRPPYGLIDEQVAAVSYRLGLVPVMWTGQAGDWNPRSAADLARRLRQATRPGAVLLLHDGGGDRSQTVAAVARLLPWWAERGYRLEPLPPCATGTP